MTLPLGLKQMLSVLKRLFNWYAYEGTEDNTPEEKRAIVFAAVVLPLVTAAYLWWSVFYLIYDARTYWPAAVVNACAVVYLFIPFVARRSRLASEITVSLINCTLFSILVYMFGAESGLHTGLLAGALLLLMYTGTKRLGFYAISAAPILFLFVALPMWFPEPVYFTDIDADLLNFIYVSNIGNLIALVLICMLVLLRRAERADDALAAEYDRSEMLLANLLPAEIAARLKGAPGTIIADEIPDVTILFADIVGFTPRAATMRPDDLVVLLNHIFSAFDELALEHGLEKIKTIGDAYMVAGGMPSPRADHAQVVAEMALDMLAVADRLSTEMGETVDMRIGIHAGSVVAGVIGTQKVFYDVWGDTVNTASRMESHGTAGRIQVSKTVRDMLAPKFRFEKRGVVTIKGMGPTQTYWLVGRKGQGV